MPVVAVDIKSRQSFADGAAFGATGDYERIDGVLAFAVDPRNTSNASIVDLEYAPVDGAGCVRFESDFTLVAPRDPSQGNGRVILEAVNRGRRRTIAFFNRGPTPPIDSDAIPEGDGFLLRHGYSVLSIGWQWDVFRSNALLGLDAPGISIDGHPVTGQACVEMRPNVRDRTRLLANREHQPYPVADLDDPGAMLLVRDWEDGPDTVIPRSQWHFPDPQHIRLESGFQPGKIYYAIYTAADPVVVGCGMLAIREAATWLRYPTDTNLLPGGYERVYGHGVSQCGRLLRHMLYLGLNLDQDGRQVFDGLLPHVAGGRMGEFNHRLAQPSCQSNPGFGHQFPFADNTLSDPLTERTDGLLERLRELDAVPKIIYTDSAAEYWRGDAALTHVDSTGILDLDPAPETRRYLFAGTQHLPGAPELMAGQGPDGSTGRHPYNAVDYIPLLRAALFNLDRWVSEGIEPPPNTHPRLHDGTAITEADYLASSVTVPDRNLPDPDRLWRIREIDVGPDAKRGIAKYPVKEGREYARLVPAADSDGNDLAGIRLPDLTVPVGTHTGWNLRHPDIGAPEQLMSMQGSTHWFPATEAQRLADSDPRPSLEKRYTNREDYASRARDAATKLADDGYLLSEDIDLVVDSSLERYDCAIGAERKR
jgi:hypothetical protein